ncbi:MAG TPA: hypothetical protein VGR71_16675 [Nitrospira sp.]|nr:hypothetical protein [Nitrospira sp.]
MNQYRPEHPADYSELRRREWREITEQRARLDEFRKYGAKLRAELTVICERHGEMPYDVMLMAWSCRGPGAVPESKECWSLFPLEWRTSHRGVVVCR